MNAEQINTLARKAIKQFGEYSFDDKGPNEVMDIDAIVKDLRTMPAEDVAKVLIEVAYGEGGLESQRGEVLASCLLNCMDDWDDLFEHNGIADLY